MSIDFWIDVGVLAGIYGIFTLGLQLNVGLHRPAEFRPGRLHGDRRLCRRAPGRRSRLVAAGWRFPRASRSPSLAGLFVGIPSLRLRSDYFAIATHRLRRDRPLHLAERRLRRRQPGRSRLRRGMARRRRLDVARGCARIGLGSYTQLPLFIVGLARPSSRCSCRSGALQATPWGRVLHGIREDEDADRRARQERASPTSCSRSPSRRRWRPSPASSSRSTSPISIRASSIRPSPSSAMRCWSSAASPATRGVALGSVALLDPAGRHAPDRPRLSGRPAGVAALHHRRPVPACCSAGCGRRACSAIATR